VYNPVIPDCNWTSEIRDDFISSDHSAVTLKMELKSEDQEKSHDLFSINESLVTHPAVQHELAKLIRSANQKWKDTGAAGRTLATLKSNVRQYLKQQTKIFRKNAIRKLSS